jgi:hypothetical protein
VTGERCFESIQGTEASFFSIRCEYKQTLEFIQTPVQWVPDALAPGRGMRLAIHLHLMPRLMNCGAKSSLPHTSPYLHFMTFNEAQIKTYLCGLFHLDSAQFVFKAIV